MLATPTSTPHVESPLRLEQIAGRIEFDGVRFSYADGATEALRGLSVVFEPGETVAVVGETGAGKSTLLKLLTRFYDPTAGSIRVPTGPTCGASTSRAFAADSASFRRSRTCSPAPCATRSPTAVRTRAVNRSRLQRCRRCARDGREPAAWLPASGRRGRQGPVRRTTTAAGAGPRAQLVDPDVLLLDEAMATLDLATEAVVTRATRRLTALRTTLVIAHRLTTAQHCDRVLVLAAGRIAEAGTHEELIAAKGRYAGLWAAFAGGSDSHGPAYDGSDGSDGSAVGVVPRDADEGGS